MTSYKASSAQRIKRQVPMWKDKPTKRPLFQDAEAPPMNSTFQGTESSVNRNLVRFKDMFGLNTDSWIIWAAMIATAGVTIGTTIIGLIWGIDAGLRNLLLCEIALGAFLLSMLAILSRIDYLEACRAYRANQEAINPFPERQRDDHIYSMPAHTPITVRRPDSTLNYRRAQNPESDNTSDSSNYSLNKKTAKIFRHMRKPFESD
ncbi:MAG: hypothetical protein SVY53_03020 [Chloroflexota bacterium]|nr:hypothetical protein [Chloroflexota bacterium]